MKISTGLYPEVEETVYEGDTGFATYFELEPGTVKNILYSREKPQIVRKGVTIPLYPGQHEYNAARDKDTREYYAVPKDVQVRDESNNFPSVTTRIFTWYEVIV